MIFSSSSSSPPRTSGELALHHEGLHRRHPLGDRKLWYEWSRSVDDPSEYVLVEAFRDAEAGAEHVAADHFRRGLESMRPALSETPRIINTEVPGTEWSRMGELEIAQ